ncbi:MAG TPA: flagellar hook-length control protein FliK, partial [Dissulfurispiraceae bacterium]|nr:flagellar hook-length control protein FliK [Dissulfurispiraceae bacterium]
RRSIHDSGIALEAKLKTLAADAARQSPSEALSRTSSDSAGREVGQDLKARLLQLRELLQNTGETGADVSAQARGHQERGEGIAAQVANRGQLLQQADGLLRDIETLQALSKATDSFFTFLPVSWKELKDGEISFRKTRGSEKETPFSCRINLDLEKFGKMSVTVLQHNREFFVSFRVENEGFRSHLSDHMEELRQSLAQKGMPLRALHVHPMDDESTDILEPESFERNISIRA